MENNLHIRVSRSNEEIFEDYSADLCDKFKSNTAQKFSYD